MLKIIILGVLLFWGAVSYADDIISTEEGTILVLDIGGGDAIITGDAEGVILNLD